MRNRDEAKVVAARRLAPALWLSLAGVAAMGAAGGQAPKLPDYATVAAAVRVHFEALPDQRPQDIISRGQVADALDKVAKLGWEVQDLEEILKAVPADNDRLVKQLRTKAGKRFMRSAAGEKGAFDRIDRLGRLPDGQRILSDLIAGPDGYKLVKYLTSSSGGTEMGRMLSRTPDGADFNKPTGRIYTVQQLLTRLETSHSAAMKAKGRKALSAPGEPIR